MRQFLPILLLIQVALAIFMPPIEMASAGKKIFLSEVWIFFWLPFALWDWMKLQTSRSRWFLLSSFFLIVIALFHGYFRIELTDVYRHFYGSRYPNDEFDLRRELPVALRFLSWLWAAGYVFWARPPVSKVFKSAVLGILIFATTVLGACAFLPFFSERLGKIYGYSDALQYWNGRAFGTFQSPLEAASSLVLCAGILWILSEGKTVRTLSAMLALAASFFAGTLSPFIGASVGFGIAWLFSKFRISRGFWVTVILVPTFGAIACFLLYDDWAFLRVKLNHLVTRTDLWKFIFQATVSRWDTFLMGMGFTSFHVDNSGLFVFSRGGIFGLAFIIYWGVAFLKETWKEWSWMQKGFFLSLLITSISLDTIIIRPVVLIMIAAGIPAFSRLSSPQRSS